VAEDHYLDVGVHRFVGAPANSRTRRRSKRYTRAKSTNGTSYNKEADPTNRWSRGRSVVCVPFRADPKSALPKATISGLCALQATLVPCDGGVTNRVARAEQEGLSASSRSRG
jgi:hypothetical protein